MNRKKRTAQIWDQIEIFGEAHNNYHMYCVISFAGFIDAGKLKRAFGLTFSVFPILASRYVKRFWSPCWKYDEAAAGEEFFRLVESTDLEREKQSFYADEIDEHGPVQIKVRVIRSGNCDTLCIAMNHMICDAAAFKEYLYIVSDIYTKLCGDDGYVPSLVLDGNRSAVGMYGDFIKAQRGLKKRLRVLFRPQNHSGYSLKMPLTESGETHADVVTRTIERQRFEAIKAYGKVRGATVNDIFLAAFFRALTKFLPEKTGSLEVPCMIDLRRFQQDRPFDALYNLTSTLVVGMGEDIGDSFDETLKKVHDTVSALLADFPALNGYLYMILMFALMPYAMLERVIKKAFKSFPIAYSNLGIIDQGRLKFDSLAIRDCFMTGSIKQKPCFWMAVSTAAG